MLEVMIALAVATIGLLGTLAVQQTIFRATGNANDGAVATRLALELMEQYDAKVVSPGPPIVDQLAATVTGGWSLVGYANALGAVGGTAATSSFRFKEEVQVANLGPTLPYNVSIQVTFSLDTGAPKTVRLDSQRWKTW